MILTVNRLSFQGRCSEAWRLSKRLKLVFQRPEPDKLIALKIFFAEAVLHHLTVKFFHAAGEVVLEAKVGQNL